jgi:hypothetical protein
LNQFIDFHESLQGHHAIEGDLDAMFNPKALAILNWWRFKVLRWMQNLHQSALDYQGLRLVIYIANCLNKFTLQVVKFGYQLQCSV